MCNLLNTVERFNNGKYQSYRGKKWSNDIAKTKFTSSEKGNRIDSYFAVSYTHLFANTLFSLPEMFFCLCKLLIVRYLLPPPHKFHANYLNFSRLSDISRFLFAETKRVLSVRLVSLLLVQTASRDFYVRKFFQFLISTK
jgi:hypothetical protein